MDFANARHGRDFFVKISFGGIFSILNIEIAAFMVYNKLLKLCLPAKDNRDCGHAAYNAYTDAI